MWYLIDEYNECLQGQEEGDGEGKYLSHPTAFAEVVYPNGGLASVSVPKQGLMHTTMAATAKHDAWDIRAGLLKDAYGMRLQD